jgi:hypothetical protein
MKSRIRIRIRNEKFRIYNTGTIHNTFLYHIGFRYLHENLCSLGSGFGLRSPDPQNCSQYHVKVFFLKSFVFIFNECQRSGSGRIQIF